KKFRESGFGTVLTHQRDGISRGTGTLVTLANQSANLVMLKSEASAQYSFNRGTSTQSYPSSIMGVIALLRQTYLDASWYKNNPAEEGKNLSLEAWNQNQNLPQIFEATDKWSSLRAYKIAQEFGVNYIIKAGGNEYQRIHEMSQTNATFILPLDFPQGMDVEDPDDARYVSLEDLKNWEMAPTNPSAFEKEKIPFCLSSDGLKDSKNFWTNLRKAIQSGLSEKAALEALTKNPATLLKVYDQVGSLENGKIANFFISDHPIFEENAVVLQNWIQGEKYDIKNDKWSSIAATYKLITADKNGISHSYTLEVKSANNAILSAKDTLNNKFSFDGKIVKLSFTLEPSSKTRSDRRGNNSGTKPSKDGSNNYSMRLSGVSNGDVWNGSGVDTAGNTLYWTATLLQESPLKIDSSKNKTTILQGKMTYPFGAYGWDELPKQKDILIQNATVWTSEKEGVLQNTDVLIKNGKIAAIGKNLSANGAMVIDGTGMHLTPGIIDEHSHIATFSINEGGQSVTSEVRIGDNLNPDDINIYRQLSGGVTTSHILHGSANTIGGQTQLIKLRWGVDADGLKFKGADPFIKFALGENVKRTTSRNNNRFPDTRMGVEEVLTDAFTRALNYENAIKAYNNRGKNSLLLPVRRDLELDALVEILNSKRFITCHSYVQSEIVSAMRVGEKFGFKFNTFTHILEGYKVADKMKKHGANASTFSDWWLYKTEVVDAIPQNASILFKMGINTAINSDDAEMARRLNQEASKSIKYGLSEEDALKMVTINPATMLHIQNQTGSIKVGKDADLVLWNNNPLSIYAVAQKTIVDGIIYFDRNHDLELRKEIQSEKNRLIQKLLDEKKSGMTMAPPRMGVQREFHCEDEDENGGSITNQ
ncbi:MAG: amidohydrolase family protein, partial [Ginsengibacter sp.]